MQNWIIGILIAWMWVTGGVAYNVAMGYSNGRYPNLGECMAWPVMMIWHSYCFLMGMDLSGTKNDNSDIYCAVCRKNVRPEDGSGDY